MHAALRALVAASVVSGLGVATVAPAEAATPPLKFGRFVFNPAGTDRAGDNAQLNRETIVVTNTTARAIAVAGYRIKDAQNHTYVFPKGYTIGARKSVTVHTGKGRNTATDVYWNQTNYVWNNDRPGDTARLQKPTGAAVTSCGYSTAAQLRAGYRYC
ncbi:lamin tail domain-containing protein [Flexivirga sp. ID2601S]|uniref:Lamin tail domain-containing protein n=1 Tax=Flexivirga aerilata TaxID=1656889 RepID=A0A849AMK1_9MICO|nr:lamin tail domain-containing protein [Flexivirga aerilata]NNG38042.1 lamin tail domain-containing protein [Flexivirga aerilata]